MHKQECNKVGTHAGVDGFSVDDFRDKGTCGCMDPRNFLVKCRCQ